MPFNKKFYAVIGFDVCTVVAMVMWLSGAIKKNT